MEVKCLSLSAGRDNRGPNRQTDRGFVTEESEGLDVCFMDEKMLL